MLSKPVKRDLSHNRTIKGKGYKREDGLWDIEVLVLELEQQYKQAKNNIL